MNFTLQLFEKLLAGHGIRHETDEMDLAKSLVFYVLKKWQAESQLHTNPPLHFSNLYERDKMVIIANVIVILECMANLTKRAINKVIKV